MLGYAIAAFLVFCVGSYCTYSDIRNTAAYLPAYLIVSLLTAYIWVLAVKGKENVYDILFLSLLWDSMVLGAYYIAPIICKGVQFGWQAYVSSAFVIIGIIWFKVATSQ